MAPKIVHTSMKYEKTESGQEFPDDMDTRSNKTESKIVFKPGDELADVRGWKRDAKKITYIVLAIAVVFGAFMLLKNTKTYLWGLRLHSPVEAVKYQRYSNEDYGFSFAFPTRYAYDADAQKRYGDSYLAGFHLETDQRTGCDIRKSEIGINFAKNSDEINEAMSKNLESHVKGFSGYSGKRIKINDENAMRTDFLMTDPLGGTLHVMQVMVSHGGQDYMLVCGSGEAQYQYFQDDFQDFLDMFRWKR